MNSTNVQDRVKRNETMDRFCTPDRKMLYEPVNNMERLDATLWSEHNPMVKMFGLAKVVTQLGNYGNNPVVSTEKETVDFLYELAMLCGVKAALVFRFRDKEMYWKIEEPYRLPFENNMKRGKSNTTYKIPIGYLKQL